MSKRGPAVRFVIITVLLDMIGIGIIIPVLPNLVKHLSGDDLTKGSIVFGLFVASYALMQFLFAPVLGSLSDAYGRRPVILLSLLGSGIDYLIMAFAPSLAWLFVGRVLSGITGANITASNAYIADVTPPEERARAFGMLGACFGVGFVLGPVLGGWLAVYGDRAPFLATAILSLLNAAYGFFVLPESHPRELRKKFELKTTHALASLMALREHPAILRLAGVLTLERLAHDALPSTWVLYTTHRFNWTPKQNGLSLGLVGISFAVISGFLTGRIVKSLGERRTLIAGMAVGALTFFAYGFATQGWMLYVAIVIGSIGGVAGPALQAIITKLTPPRDHGSVQGAVASIQSFAAIAGPLLATNLFAWFTSDKTLIALPGAAFIASGLLVAAGCLLAFFYVHTDGNDAEKVSQS